MEPDHIGSSFSPSNSFHVSLANFMPFYFFFLLNFLVGVGHPWEHENLTRGQSSSKENDSLSSETIHSQEHLSGAGSSLSSTPPPMLSMGS